MVSEQKVLIEDLALQINQPSLPELIRQFLYDQQYPECPLTSTKVSLHACPPFSGMIFVFASAITNYYAPSDPSGIRGMHRKHIRATPSWRQGPARYDCAFVNSKPVMYHISTSSNSDISDVFCCFPTCSDVFRPFPL